MGRTYLLNLINFSAACTSAAPFFFKSKDIDNLDTFQDGGLRHNCPAFLASWECGTLWPDKGQMFESDRSQVDHLVSLGTGTSLSQKYEIGPHTPVKDRFIHRLVGNYKCHLDGEEQWRTFNRCIPLEARDRYFRLNVPLRGCEPALDDIAAMQQLKHLAQAHLLTDAQRFLIKDNMIASCFYLELDSVTPLEGGSYQCQGTIFCRLPLDISGRRALNQALLEAHALFVVNGHGFPCARSLPQGSPMFRSSLDFIVKSMDDKVKVCITGITNEPTVISRMPTDVGALMKAQSMGLPFGCINHTVLERPLPLKPTGYKRKMDDI
jgi:hypothetical protein